MIRKNRISNPELFQGRKKQNHYFEGWYFKHVSSNGAHCLSIISGINFESAKPSAFIQIIIGPLFKSYYIDFDYEDFSWSDEPFQINIRKNSFSLDQIKLDIKTPLITFKGEIKYNNRISIDRSLFCPNIMGVFAYFKFMQCNHGVLSLNHDLNGQISYNNQIFDFDNGKGYIEKDWGDSFPKKYCWLQCNNFEDDSVSIFLSIARIPFLTRQFIGFIGVLRIGEKQYRFATYNQSSVLKAIFKNGILSIDIKRKSQRLKVEAFVKEGLTLKAPHKGIMKKDIKETLEGQVNVSLYDHNILIFEGKGSCAGVEVVDWKDLK